MHKTFFTTLIALTTSIIAAAAPVADVVKPQQKYFPLSQVRLLASPFKEAQDKDAAYLLTVDVDRLMANFRENAGLKPVKPRYDGWESQTIAGHSLGHYLSAVSMMFAATGDERFRSLSERVVRELGECQADDGLVSAIPNIRKLDEELRRGEIRSQGFDLNGIWVPWYTQHKVVAGLLDAYRYCENKDALAVAAKLGDWGIDVTSKLSDEQFQQMLRCEFGGMNEVYYDLYAFTGEKKYFDMAERFYDKQLFEPLSEGKDVLPGRHGNTQFPKAIGLARRYELTGDEKTLRTLKFFWDRVVKHQTYVNGGNTLGEHFGQPDKLNDRLGDSNSETCNTYNMLKLTRHLASWTPNSDCDDFYERGLYNHILASIARHGGANELFTYYVPLQAGGFRRYSSPEHDWTCCHGTGMENHSKYGEAIYTHGVEDGRDVVYVKLLIPSVLDWKEKGLRISITEDLSLHVEADKPSDVIVKVRVPRNTHCDAQSDSFYLAGDNWSGNEVVSLPFVAYWATEAMSDNPDRVAFFFGPYLYAGDLGATDLPIASPHDAPSDASVTVPVIVSASGGVPELVAVNVLPPQLIETYPSPVTLRRFADLTQRYCVYFDCFTPATWSAREAEYKALQEAQRSLEARTVDFFQPGEMQPERDHSFRGEKTTNGEAFGRRWRDARDGGWMEFTMKRDPNAECSLILTYWGSDVGNRVFDIIIDGEKVATQRLGSNAPEKFFDVVHKIPQTGGDSRDSVVVKLQAHSGAMAGGLFGCRVVREKE
ncbi:MAG: beta-L-arabinofuranosidase domain-containing protein [Thermoguttaceae bacterium]